MAQNAIQRNAVLVQSLGDKITDLRQQAIELLNRPTTTNAELKKMGNRIKYCVDSEAGHLTANAVLQLLGTELEVDDMHENSPVHIIRVLYNTIQVHYNNNRYRDCVQTFVDVVGNLLQQQEVAGAAGAADAVEVAEVAGAAGAPDAVEVAEVAEVAGGE